MGREEVEIGEATDAWLEELQAEVRRETGTTVSKSELLERAIENASLDELLDAFGDDFEGLDADERRRALENRSELGVETAEDEIDDVLYGE